MRYTTLNRHELAHTRLPNDVLILLITLALSPRFHIVLLLSNFYLFDGLGLLLWDILIY